MPVNRARITGQDAVHIRRALRMREGEHLILCDGAGTDYACVIDGFDGDAVVLRVEECQATTAEPTVQVTLYQGLPKGDKMDWIVQKAVELGVQRIVPVEMSRSVARLGANARQKTGALAADCGRGGRAVRARHTAAGFCRRCPFGRPCRIWRGRR